MADDIKFTKPGQKVTIRAVGTRASGTTDLQQASLAAGDSVKVLGVGATAPPTDPPHDVPPTAELPAPTGLRFETENGEVYVAFDPVAGAETHHVEVRNAQGTVLEIDTIAAIVSGPLALATGYVVNVWAVNAAGVRIGAVGSITYVAIPPATEKPGTPGAPTFRVTTGGNIEAAWTGAARATGYRVSLDQGGLFHPNGPAMKTTDEPEAAILGTTWRGKVTVTPFNAAGDGPSSSATYGTPTPVPNPVPVPVPGPLPQPGGGGTAVVPYYEKQWPATLAVGGDVEYIYGAQSTPTGTLIDGSTGRFFRSGPRPAGHEPQHGVNLSPPNALIVRPRKLWWKVPLRFTGGGWANSADDKSAFIIPDYRFAGGDSETNRWDIYLRGAGAFYGGPYPQGVVPDWIMFDKSPKAVFDGGWHELEGHYEMASNETATDGIYQVKIDGEFVCNRVGIATGNPAAAFFRVFALGRNSYSAEGASRDWGALRVYTSKPAGW